MKSRTAIRQNRFSHRVVNIWNDLPVDVVLADSLNQFENKLEFFWKHRAFKYEMTFKYD